MKFDGRSIRPLLEGKASPADGSWPDRILVTDSQRVQDPIKWRKSAVMTSRWRLVNGEEIYDIKQDPRQESDVAGAHPEVVVRLKAFSERRLLEYLKRVISRLGLRGHLHTFRHSFISHALTLGTPEAIVRQWVGHVDPEVLKIYTHVFDDASQAAMQRLAEANTNSDAPEGKEAHDDCKEKNGDSAQFQHTERRDQYGRLAK